MNDDARLERIFSDALAESAPSRAPDRLRADIKHTVSQTRPRPRWLAILKEPPMHFDGSVALGSPMARLSSLPARRAAWLMLLVALTIALAAATLVIGAWLLRDPGPDRVNSAVLVPTLVLDQTWDQSTIAGLNQPSGMDVGPDGNLYVVNAGASEIIVLDPDGHIVRRWGELGSGAGQFIFHGDTEDPFHSFGGIAVTPDGSVFVMDTENDRVQQFDLMGTFIREWGGYGTGDDQFILAWDISDAPDSTLVIGDNGRGNIRRFGQDGTYQATLASVGTTAGSLSQDTGGIVVDGAGLVYSADGIGKRILSWEADGALQKTFGIDGPSEANLTYPYDVAVDDAGNVYATDPDRVVIYLPNGTLASIWAIPDPFDRHDALNTITIGPDGSVFVSAWRQDTIFRLRSVDQEIEANATSAATSTPASPLPSPSALPSAAPFPTPMAAGLVVSDTFAVPFTADQPADWKVNWLSTGGVELAKPVPGSTEYIDAAVRVFVPTNAYADACASGDGPMSPPIGPTVDDLVTALTRIPGVRVSVPVTDITIDGFQGKSFDLEVMLTSSDCPDDGPWFPMWTYDEAGRETFAGPGSNFHQHIAVLDVDGTRVLIESWTFNGTSYRDIVDTERVFDSIDFQ